MSDPKWKATVTADSTPEAVEKAAAVWKNGTWWQEGKLPSFGEHTSMDPMQWSGLPMLRRAFEGGPPVRVASWTGKLIVPADKLISKLNEILGTRLMLASGTCGKELLLASDDTMIRFKSYSRDREANIKLVTTTFENFDKANRILNTVLTQEDPREGTIFALASGMNGLYLQRIGAAGTALERDNYTSKVMEAYDHIVEELSTESPCGRLSVLSGEPGTGKTFLVRNLLTHADKAAFILVPAHMMQDMAGPEILPVLANATSELDGPAVLVVEDGDKVLVKREAGDMSAISALLNLGDGILGNVLDIRIIATTNAPKLEMDPATRRDGRLCSHVLVDALAPGQADKVLQRLCGSKMAADGVFTKPTALATVYKKARTMGWKPPSDRKKACQNHVMRPELL